MKSAKQQPRETSPQAPSGSSALHERTIPADDCTAMLARIQNGSPWACGFEQALARKVTTLTPVHPRTKCFIGRAATCGDRNCVEVSKMTLPHLGPVGDPADFADSLGALRRSDGRSRRDEVALLAARGDDSVREEAQALLPTEWRESRQLPSKPYNRSDPTVQCLASPAAHSIDPDPSSLRIPQRASGDTTMRREPPLPAR